MTHDDTKSGESLAEGTEGQGRQEVLIDSPPTPANVPPGAKPASLTLAECAWWIRHENGRLVLSFYEVCTFGQPVACVLQAPFDKLSAMNLGRSLIKRAKEIKPALSIVTPN